MYLYKIITLLISISYIFCHDEDEYTVVYTADNFLYPNKNSFVMFYAPWCGHCQRLGPTWEQLAEMLNDDTSFNICIAKVDCTVHKELCSEHDVTGYPTLKFFKEGSTEGVKFKGTRDLPSLTTFIKNQLGDVPSVQQDNVSNDVPETLGLLELNEDNFEKHVSKGKHFVKFYAPWCGHCQKLAPTWEQLAQSLEQDKSVSISKIDCTQNRQICNQFDIKGYPTLLWIEDGKKLDKYQGQRTHDDLKSFVNKMMGNVGRSPADEELTKEAASPVVVLTGNDFEQHIKSRVAFVKFFAPWCGHCKRLSPTWEELGKEFESNPSITIAKVDCTLDVNKKLCNEQEVDGFPTLFLYKNGQKSGEYKGTRSLKELIDFVKKEKHDEL